MLLLMPSAMIGDRTYSPEEVADALDRHPESIRRNLRRGDVDGDKFQGRWIITDQALRDWLPTPLYEEAFDQNDS